MRIFLFLFLGISLGCNSVPIGPSSGPAFQETRTLKKRPKNVVLMIGDGMGLTQITAGMYGNANKLNLEDFTHTGLHTCHSGNSYITDSAAGATAFASGHKTYNGAIGVDMDTFPVVNILEQAETANMATGLVSTSSITHATPAAFIAHVSSRYKMEEIALDILNVEVDLLIGGGKKFFSQRTMDKRNLYTELLKKDYFVSDYSRERLSDLAIDTEQNFVYFTADNDPAKVLEGRDYLTLASQIATRFLKEHEEAGFFLMIEAAQIDWGGHAMDPEWVISEMIDFDRAIGQVLNFAKADGETLVIVTADHETGGLSINPGSRTDGIEAAFSSANHTASIIPVFAYGPGAELFSGVYDNIHIYGKMAHALNLKEKIKIARQRAVEKEED
ncbi:MAG: alkaline phosphatase [Saprospiraceae bacterium]|nr:alkaline phosphatase [Saprospiraceae bacterium]